MCCEYKKLLALGRMNVLWMGLFTVIIFAVFEKVWSKGGHWIPRITGIGFMTIGILSLTEVIS